MPLPLGHAAVGFTVHHILNKDKPEISLWKIILYTATLSNLPDVDVIIGLLVHGNGCFYHRGPTHSILFALFSGLVAANLSRFWIQIPRMSFWICFSIILSHLLTDLIFTSSPVSLFWPLEVYWAMGYSGWIEVVSQICLRAFQDVGIISGCLLILFAKELLSRFLNIPKSSLRKT